MAENYDLIFGQSASSQYAWSDSDYQNGWQTVGSTPPTAEQFDALQRRNDKKAQELNNALTPLVNQNTANNRQPLTAYALKDIRYSPLLPTGWFLECTTAGTTDSAEITLPSPLVENATITDGTCVWKVRKIDITQYENELGGKADRSLSNLTDAGKSFSFPSDTYVEITVSSTGQTYTAPADGYICIDAIATNNSAWVSLGAGKVQAIATQSVTGYGLWTFLVVRKGQTAYISYTQASNIKAWFTYAQGEVPN